MPQIDGLAQNCLLLPWGIDRSFLFHAIVLYTREQRKIIWKKLGANFGPLALQAAALSISPLPLGSAIDSLVLAAWFEPPVKLAVFKFES